MYDKETDSRWSQLVGSAIDGPMQGQQLVKLPSIMTTWGKWKAEHPDTTVYVKQGIPYRSVFNQAAFERIARMSDGPARANDLVVAVEGHVQAKAYLVRRMAQERVVNDRLDGAPTLVFLSKDMTSARVLDRLVDDRELNFRLSGDDRVRDIETGSIWDPATGRALSGPLRGQELKSLISTYSLWYAWEKYRPDTILRGEEAS